MSQLAVIAELLAALLVAGFRIEWLYRRALRRFRTRLEQTPAPTFSARAFRLGIGLADRSRRDPGVEHRRDHRVLPAVARSRAAANRRYWTSCSASSSCARRWSSRDSCLRRVSRRSDCCRSPTSRRARCTGLPSSSSRVYAIELALVTLLQGGGANQATLDLMVIPRAGRSALRVIDLDRLARARADRGPDPRAGRARRDPRLARRAVADRSRPPISSASCSPACSTSSPANTVLSGRRHLQRADRRRAADRRHGAVPGARRGGRRRGAGGTGALACAASSPPTSRCFAARSTSSSSSSGWCSSPGSGVSTCSRSHSRAWAARSRARCSASASCCCSRT